MEQQKLYFLTLKEALLATRKEHIKRAVALADGNITEAARLLGLRSRSPIYRVLYFERYAKEKI